MTSVARLVKSSPRVAVESGDGAKSITYVELNQLAKSVHHQLLEYGIEPGSVVAVAPGHHVEDVAVFLGVVTGHVYAPINSAEHQESFSDTLNEYKAVCLIVPDENSLHVHDGVKAASSLGIPVMRAGLILHGDPVLPLTMCMEQNGKMASKQLMRSVSLVNRRALTRRYSTVRRIVVSQVEDFGDDEIASGDDVAVLLLTSGTTSKPKKVPITHASFSEAVTAFAEFYSLGPEDAHLHCMPLFHIGGLGPALMTTLCSGGTLILPLSFDPSEFWDHVVGKKITWFTGVPAFYIALLDRWNVDKSDTSGMPRGSKLRFLRCAAAPLSSNIEMEIESKMGVRMINSYAMSEAASVVCSNPLPPQKKVVGSVGIPVGSISVSIIEYMEVGEEFKQKETGEIGEICLKGGSVFDGYLDDVQGMNKQAFINGWFRTGDLGYLDAEGYLTITGRLKEIINKGGEKISPTEIEDIVYKGQYSAELYCFAIPDESLGQDIGILVVPKRSGDNFSNLAYSILSYCKQVLPDFKVPASIYVVDDGSVVPRSSTNKVIRMSIFSSLLANGIKPMIESNCLDARKILKNTFVAPKGSLEELITQIWENELGLTNIGVTDDILEFGVNSIKASRLAYAVQDALKNKRVNVVDILTHKTIRNLALWISSGNQADYECPIEVAKAFHGREYVLSLGQEQMLALYQMDPTSSSYNVPFGIDMKGPLDVEKLNECLKLLGMNFETLRTSFSLTSGRYQPVVLSGDEYQGIQISTVSVDSYDKEMLDRMIAKLTSKPFDLGSGPPVRATIIKLSDTHNILLLVVHHIATDGWSMFLIQKYLACLYSLDDPSKYAFPTDRISYTDFAFWQRNLMDSEVIKNQIEFWTKELFDTETLQLPTDHPRPSVQSNSGDLYAFEIAEDAVDLIRRVASENGVTLFVALMSVFQIQLSRYSGQNNFAVGTPTSGRSYKCMEETMGYFVNPLPVKANLAGSPSFNEVMRRVQESVLGLFSNSDISFVQIAKELGGNNPSHPPIFQVMMVLQERVESQAIRVRDNMEFSRVQVTSSTSSKFDITLEVTEFENRLQCRIEYCTDLFSRETIERFASHFSVLLSEVCSNPTAMVEAVSIMTKEEENLVLNAWNDNHIAVSYDKTLDEVIMEAARSRPDHTAVAHDGREITYGDLDRLSCKLANVLIGFGIGPGKIVGVLLDRTIEFIVSEVAVLRAGAAFVPIDPTYPEQRIKYIMEDIQTKYLISSKDLFGKLSPDVSNGVSLIDAEKVFEEETDCTDLVSHTKPTQNDLAYVIFTSGTTGRPKGVMIEHCNAVNMVHALSTTYRIHKDARQFQFFKIGFDGAQGDILPCLAVGATLILWTPPDWTQALKRYKVTHLGAVPSVLATMEPHMYPSLEVVVTAGEACSLALMQKWAEAVPCFINAYGPSETTVGSNAHVQFPGDTTVLIGGPMPNYKSYIVDKHFNPVPVGVPGELIIGGDGVGRGYLGKDDLTAEKFVDNPFHAGRCYKTGDLVRWRFGGSIEFLGRIDNQVKIKGYRIELGEIESVVSACNGVKQVVALVKKDAKKQDQIVVYCSPTSEIEVDKCMQRLREELPTYMVPAVMITLEEIPLAPTGKANTKALPDPEWDSIQAAKGNNEYVAPEGALEVKLQELFENALNLSDIGVNDDFWESGGSSLLAGILISSIRTEMDADMLPSTSLYDAPTIRSLAELMKKLGIAEGKSTAEIKPNVEWSSKNSHGIVPILMQFLSFFIRPVIQVAVILPSITVILQCWAWFGVWPAIGIAVGVIMIDLPLLFIVCWIILRIIMWGRIKPGKYPLWSFYYCRWMMSKRVMDVVHFWSNSVQETWLHTVLLRMFGAKVGTNVTMRSWSAIYEPDLVVIGDDVIIDVGAAIEPATIEAGGLLVIQPIVIGKGTYLGKRSFVPGGCHIPEDAMVPPMSSGYAKQFDKSLIDAGIQVQSELKTQAEIMTSPIMNVLKSLFFVVLTCMYVICLCTACACAYGLYNVLMPKYDNGVKVEGNFIELIRLPIGQNFWLSIMLLMPVFVLYLMPHVFYVLLLVLKHLVLGRPPKSETPTTWTVFRHWAMSRLMNDAPIQVLWGHISGTVWMSWYYQLLGAKIGKRPMLRLTQCSEPDLICLGDDTEIAANVLLEWGITMGSKVAVTNSAVIEKGVVLGSYSILGDMTYASPNSTFESGTVWVGAPAKHLRHNDIPEGKEIHSKALLRRYWISQVALTICQPVLTYCSIVSIFILLWVFRRLLANGGISIYWYLLIFPPVFVLGEFVQAFIMFCLKWILAGKYTTSIHPFYSYHYTSWILLTNILLQCSLVNQFGGSIWLVWWARLLGAKIGENVCYFSFRRVEMDLLQIGDKSIIGQESVLSGHTLENQVIEHIRTDIGNEAWVGARTTLLPGSSMSSNSQVNHLSLVLKGERIERANCWQGIPAAPYAKLDIPNLKILEKLMSMKHSDIILSLTRSLTLEKQVSKQFSKRALSRHETFKRSLC